jgi:hypothetical protein
MKFIYLILALLVGNNAVACESMLGTWQSSKKMSMEYNKDKAGLLPAQIELLDQILGVLKLTYTQTHIHEHGAEPLKVTVNKKQYDFYFEEIEYPYEVLYCGKNSITISQQHPHAGAGKLKLHLINDDVYWVSPDNLPNSREYFIRVKE